MIAQFNPTTGLMIRSAFIGSMCCALWVAIGFRLHHLQVRESSMLSKKAENQYGRTIKIEPERGKITDRNGNILAMNVKVKSAFCVPQEMSDIWGAAKILSPVLGIPKQGLIKQFTRKGHFSWVKRKLDSETADTIQKLNIKGLYFMDEVKRVYPKNHLLSHVLGFVDIDNRGLAGIERMHHGILSGVEGEARVFFDARGSEIASKRQYLVNPQDGKDMRLTIDEVIQNMIEEELDILVANNHPESVSVVVVEPSTGQILGLGNRPTYNSNQAGQFKPENRKNFAVVSNYEPGSIFKIISAACALENKAVTLAEPIFCEHGVFRYKGRTLHDSHPLGTEKFARVFAESSNIGFAKVMSRLSNEQFYESIRLFGFGDKTDAGLLGESSGRVASADKWTYSTVTSISMGHEIMVTPLQMAYATCVPANKGLRPRSQLVLENGKSAKNAIRVVSEKTARDLTLAMRLALGQKGTAPMARIPGYSAAGKTGTAQKVINGTYSNDHYVSSFTGFAPAEDPRIVITVMVDDPKGKSYYGGKVAGPIFARLGYRILKYLKIPARPDEEILTELFKLEEKYAA